MTEMDLTSGRTGQKQRTRQALLEAAQRLVRDGRRPSMTEVAAEAGVSRMTAYRYFPKLEALLLEAPLHMRTTPARELLAPLADAPPDQRACHVAGYLYDLAAENEAEFRMYLRATMDQWLEQGGGDEPLRGGRRVEMLDLALAGCSKQLGRGGMRRLRNVLAALGGIEALIVMRDICRSSTDQGRADLQWAVRTLVRAALAETSPPKR